MNLRDVCPLFHFNFHTLLFQILLRSSQISITSQFSSYSSQISSSFFLAFSQIYNSIPYLPNIPVPYGSRSLTVISPREKGAGLGGSIDQIYMLLNIFKALLGNDAAMFSNYSYKKLAVAIINTRLPDLPPKSDDCTTDHKFKTHSMCKQL